MLFLMFFKFSEKIWYSAKYTIYSALLWEVCQIDTWWNVYNYKLTELLNYYWIDTALDLALAVVGIVIAVMVIRWNDGTGIQLRTMFKS